MAGPSWTRKNSDGGAGSGPSFTRKKPAYKPAPEGYEVVEDFGDGSYVVLGSEGNPSFVDQNAGYSTSDIGAISEIIKTKKAGGSAIERAGQISVGEDAQRRVGEGTTRVISAAEGIPFIGEAIAPLAAGMRSEAQGTNFADELNTLKTAVGRREQEAPKTVGASRLATGLAASAPFAAKQKAQSTLGKMGEGAMVGSVAGGSEGLISGFIEGYFDDPEQGFLDRIGTGYENAKTRGATGALFGGGFGAALPPLADTAGYLYSQNLKEPVRKIVEKIGFKDDAAKIVEETLAMDAAGAVESAAVQGPYGSIATIGPNTNALLDVVANSPSEGARIARKNLKETAVAASNDLVGILDSVLGTPAGRGGGIKTQKAEIMEKTAQSRRDLYESAYDFKITPETDGGEEVLKLFSQVTSENLDGAKKLLQQDGEAFNFIGGKKMSQAELNDIKPSDRNGLDVVGNADGSYTVSRTPTVATIDYVTREMLDQVKALRMAGNDAGAQSKRLLAMKLRASLDAVNPDYAAARAAGKDAIDQKLMADLGNDLLRPSFRREDLLLETAGMDETSIKQLRIALRNAIDEQAANARVNPRGDNEQEVVEALATLKSMNSRAVADKLEMALGVDDAARIGTQIAQTSSALMQSASVAMGSKTAIRQMVADRMKEMVGESLGETVSRQGLLSTVTGAATDAMIGGPKQSQRVRNAAAEIAPVLTQRKTQAQLVEEARQMEQMTKLIDRANRGGRNASDLIRSTGTPITAQQSSQGPDSATEGLLRQMGLGMYPR